MFWHGLSFYFSLLLHFTVGLTVNFSVLLWRYCTCICKKIVCYFAGPPSTLPLSTQTSSGSSTLSKKRPPPPPPGHKRTLSDPPSPLPHGPQNKGPIPWGEFWNAKQKGRGKPLWWMIYDLWFLLPDACFPMIAAWCNVSSDKSTVLSSVTLASRLLYLSLAWENWKYSTLPWGPIQSPLLPPSLSPSCPGCPHPSPLISCIYFASASSPLLLFWPAR